MYFEQSLHDWVISFHEAITKSYKMKFDIDETDYGYASYAAVISAILKNVTPRDILSDIDYAKYTDIAHRAWSENYIHWKNTSSEDISIYDRNHLATTLSKNLVKSDIAMYRDVITILFDMLKYKVLCIGLGKMNVTN